MKCGIVGLGGIARKAYLPVITRLPDLELVLCTRNSDALHQVGEEYRLEQRVEDVQALMDTGIQAAFVHTATESHYGIVKTLLENDIHVYVDKPMAYTYAQSRELVELAEQRERILMVGFNRRFAPMVSELDQVPQRKSVFIQKNRENSPGEPRFVLFDDFIHVVDTLRYLSPEDVDVEFDARVEKGLLYHVLVRFSGHNFIGIGSMGRDFGVNEEIIEVTTYGRKWRVEGLDETVHHAQGKTQVRQFGSWDPVLLRRGFQGILEHFVDCVSNGQYPQPSARDSLKSHEICEKIAAYIE